MNSITFVVDKLTPPSTPLHPQHPSSSGAASSSTRPDSGYYSLYASDGEDKSVMNDSDSLIRRRQVGESHDTNDLFQQLDIPAQDIPTQNRAMRGMQYVMAALTGLLWTLLYPFSKLFRTLRRLFSRNSSAQTHFESPMSSMVASPYTFPDVTSSDNLPLRPLSSSSSVSEASSSGTDSDAETDISTLAPSDISEASSASSIPSLRRSPRLHSSSENEELMALNRRRTADSLKSPTSPRTPSMTSKTNTSLAVTTPKTAVQLIPRPLIPAKPSQKTLVLDLDETLIHSLAKGGKLGSGHMVEVKFDKHAILYFVHKRPFCDLFLRKVSKWYDCVIFTASVQEYADPVIDWLEAERKIFKARYYRQHCTIENGAYIKDLSVVERDLGRVCILDNSPISYAYHEANAIPIEGWISDPTDNDLLHLIPFLRALRFVNDVRSLLGLRTGARKT